MSYSKKEIKENLFLATEAGDLEMVKKIIEDSPELIDSQSMINWTPVMMACRYGHKDIVQYLHENGAQMERERGYTAIHAACYSGDIDTLKYLLEVAKVNPNPESQERIPLYIALSTNKQLIDLLLKHGVAYEVIGTSYIDSKTGQPVTKNIRFNDNLRKINDKFVLQFNLTRNDQNTIEFLKQINIPKFYPILQAYKKGKFSGITDDDFKAILKYM
eukprot:403352510